MATARDGARQGGTPLRRASSARIGWPLLVVMATAGSGCEGPGGALRSLQAGASTPSPSPAAAGTPPQSPAEPAEPVPQDDLDRGTPRGAVLGFMRTARARDWKRAADYLDLGVLPAAERAAEGPVLARHLKAVLERKLWLDRADLSDQPRGDLEDGLASRRERVGTIETKQGPLDVQLERQTRSGEPPLWRFSAKTVARIPALYDLYGYGPLGEILPEAFFDIRFLDVALWQWLALLLLVLVATGLSWLLSAILLRALRPVVTRTENTFDDRLLATSSAPVRLALFALLLRIGSPLLALSLRGQEALLGAFKMLTIVAASWFVLRFVDVASQALKAALISRGHEFALSIVPLVRRALQVFVGMVALVVLLQNVGVNVTGILAGLGIGGLAVALAAQKTVENLFGGVSLILDQPVRVGDSCRYGDRVGVVEDIGLRSTRIRSPDRSVVSIPNSVFATMQIENFGPRDRFWFHPTLKIRRETSAAQLRDLLARLRELLAEHPKVLRAGQQVRLVRLAESSFDVEVVGYVETRDGDQFLEIQEELLLRLIEVVERSGTSLAYPSQTLYLGRDPGPGKTT